MDIEIGVYTVKDVAEMLRTTEAAIHTAYCEGKTGITIPPSVKVGKRRLFKKADVHQWFDDLPCEGGMS